MAGTVKIALHPSVDQAGLVSRSLEAFADTPMNLHAVRAVLDLGDGLFLRVLHGLVESFQFRAGRSTNDRPRHVGKVARRGRPWKHVEDNAALRRQVAAAFIVRIAGLLSAGDD